MSASTWVSHRLKLKEYPIGPGRILIWTLAALGVAVSIYRWMYGLRAASSLVDGRSWGLWISFDLLVGIAVSSGAFITAACVYIFNMKKLYPILRPAVLTGFLGYLMAIFALMVDLGLPLNIWHILVYWNIHSPLFEVGWCVVLYSLVLFLEFSPVLFEGLGWKNPLRLSRKFTVPLVIVGIMLSTLHQSSLGTLWLITPERIHPLWFSPLLPIAFLVSAIAAGPAMIAVESHASASVYHYPFEKKLVVILVRAIPYILALYLTIKVVELVVFNKWQILLMGGWSAVFWLAEIIIGVIIPMYLFTRPSVLNNRYRILWSAVLVLIGLVLNRFNVSLIFFEGTKYLPAWTEIAVSVGYVCLGITLYDLVARAFPLFEHAE